MSKIPGKIDNDDSKTIEFKELCGFFGYDEDGKLLSQCVTQWSERSTGEIRAQKQAEESKNSSESCGTGGGGGGVLRDMQSFFLESDLVIHPVHVGGGGVVVGAGGGAGGMRAAGAREIGDECVAVIAEIESRLHALLLADRSQILALQGRLAEAENTLKGRRTESKALIQYVSDAYTSLDEMAEMIITAYTNSMNLLAMIAPEVLNIRFVCVSCV